MSSDEAAGSTDRGKEHFYDPPPTNRTLVKGWMPWFLVGAQGYVCYAGNLLRTNEGRLGAGYRHLLFPSSYRQFCWGGGSCWCDKFARWRESEFNSRTSTDPICWQSAVLFDWLELPQSLWPLSMGDKTTHGEQKLWVWAWLPRRSMNNLSRDWPFLCRKWIRSLTKMILLLGMFSEASGRVLEKCFSWCWFRPSFLFSNRAL